MDNLRIFGNIGGIQSTDVVMFDFWSICALLIFRPSNRLAIRLARKRRHGANPLVSHQKFQQAWVTGHGECINGLFVDMMAECTSPRNQADPFAVHCLYFGEHKVKSIRSVLSNNAEGPLLYCNWDQAKAPGDRGILHLDTKGIHLPNENHIVYNHIPSPKCIWIMSFIENLGVCTLVQEEWPATRRLRSRELLLHLVRMGLILLGYWSWLLWAVSISEFFKSLRTFIQIIDEALYLFCPGRRLVAIAYASQCQNLSAFTPVCDQPNPLRDLLCKDNTND